MTQKNIVISGGLGYVGGRLSKFFADQGHQVYALSRNKNVSYTNIKVLSNQEVLEGDVLKEKKIDVFIHLASTNEIECGNDPIESNKININGTLQWLNWAKQNLVGQFIYFSTVHVYARPLVGEFDEESTCHPLHPYAISHKAAEDYVLWYQKDFNLNIKIVRLSNAFGYPAFSTANRWTLFINDICKQIIEKNQFEIHSNAQQERDFISLSEVCIAVSQLIDYPILVNGNPVFNLSKGKSISLFEIGLKTKTIAEKLLNRGIKIIYHPEKSQTVSSILIANNKLKTLNWTTSDDFFKEEIEGTLSYFQIKKTQ